MPTLPAMPVLTQAQYDALVPIFAEMAADQGLPGAAEAYVRWSVTNLIDLLRRTAYLQADEAAEELRVTRRAEAEAMLAGLLSG